MPGIRQLLTIVFIILLLLGLYYFYFLRQPLSVDQRVEDVQELLRQSRVAPPMNGEVVRSDVKDLLKQSETSIDTKAIKSDIEFLLKQSQSVSNQ